MQSVSNAYPTDGIQQAVSKQELRRADHSAIYVATRGGRVSFREGDAGGVEQAKTVLRFGVFELDAEAGELRRDGRKVHLAGQPVEILGMLLERPGRVVTRDELRSRLWPADTFVEFEHSLNAAVMRLRQALGDNAETPRYVETLPRRGYRFLAEVRSSGAAANFDPGAFVQGFSSAIMPATMLPAEPPKKLRRGMLLVGIVAGLLMLSAGLAIAWYFMHPG
jgi:DNA-binding winged helix-turn-helix (wHTH) protein